MPEGSPRWIVLTTFVVLSVFLRVFVLVTERTLVGHVMLVAASTSAYLHSKATFPAAS